VDLSLLDVDQQDLDTNALDRGLALIEEVVPRPEVVRVVVASDFVQAVRERVDDADYAAAYGADRLFGRATGKAIGHDDGTTDLVLDSWVLSKTAAPEGNDVERMFHHEALHIAVSQRGEQMNDIRIRNGYATNSNRGYFGAVTGVMIEEYRTERALCEAGRWPHEDHMGNFDAAVHAFACAAADGVHSHDLGEPIGRCYEMVVNTFHQLATYTGYVAAEMLACDRERRPEIEPAARRRLLGSAWEGVIDSLDAIPSAATVIVPAELEALAWSTVDRVEDWLEHVGFTLEDLPQGGVYFHVLRCDFESPFE
jgi:hypothetical protein